MGFMMFMIHVINKLLQVKTSKTKAMFVKRNTTAKYCSDIKCFTSYFSNIEITWAEDLSDWNILTDDFILK